MKKLASEVISRCLDNYINPLQSSQLKLAIGSGSAEFHNVEIKSTALSVHHLPFTVKYGLIRTIKLHLSLTDSWLIEIDGIHIIANFSKGVELKSELEIKESVLKELENAGVGNKKVKEIVFGDKLSQILSNIIIRLKNIHIRVEIDTPNPDVSFAVGLICQQIELSAFDDKKVVKSDANISKRIQIQDFSLYIDSQPERCKPPATPGSVESYLQMRFKEAHEYILESFSFSSELLVSKIQFQTKIKMDNIIPQLYFKITQRQTIALAEYLYQTSLFQLRYNYSLCGRPTQFPIAEEENDEKQLALQWWTFAHQATIQKRFPNRINIGQVINQLKSRDAYYELWKIRQSMNPQDFHKSSRYPILKKLEDSLSLASILLLRNYSEYRINKEKQKECVLDSNDLEMFSNPNTFETSADISLFINKLKVKFYEANTQSKPILTFAALELNSLFALSFDQSMSFSFVCKAMKIYSKDRVLFSQNVSDKSSIEFSYSMNPLKKEESIAILASAPFINVDLKFLYRLKLLFYDNGFAQCPSSSYFSFSQNFANMLVQESNKQTPYMIRKGEYSDKILQKKCDEFRYLKLAAHITTPTVQIQGAQLSFQMKEIHFESLPIHERFANQVDTLYINYLLKCMNFSIGLGDHEILRPVTMDVNFGTLIAPVEWLDKFKISLMVSSIAVVFNKNSYCEIVHGLRQLLKLSQDFEQTEDGKALTKKGPAPKTSYMENVNVENLSMNYATKVSILFNNISLELVDVGRFDIVNFESKIAVGSDGLNLDLRIENIICNSLENKYIFFNVREMNTDNQFQKEYNALTCHYTLCFDKALKLGICVNSPTIIIDFGWIETVLDFFKSADIKVLMNAQKTPAVTNDETDHHIMESVMINCTEFELLDPSFKVILPAVNKCKDDVELMLNIDYITFGETGNETNGKPNMLMKMPILKFEWKQRLMASINNFSVLISDKTAVNFDHFTVVDVVENATNIEIKPIKQPFVLLGNEENKMITAINDCKIIFDINSYMIPDLVLSLLKSSVVARIVSSFMDETEIMPKATAEEKEATTVSQQIQMSSVDITLRDHDVELHSHFSGLFHLDQTIYHFFFQQLNLSISENRFQFLPIFDNVTCEFGIRNDTLIFSISDTNISISPSDIIDIKNFVDKIVNLYSTFQHQLDYSKPIETSEEPSQNTKIKKLCITNSNIIVNISEDNRICSIPTPFLRVTMDPYSNTSTLVSAPSFPLLGFQIEIFNKSTQRWDLLIEPVTIYLAFTNTKNYTFEIKPHLNLILTHAILNQICNFQFERQKVTNQNYLPPFFVQNNTHEICELVFDDACNNILIPPGCFSANRFTKPFKFMNYTIDPLNFYSPQFISNKYSIAIFNKDKEKHITINSPLLLKNRSNLDLLYQEKHTGAVIDIVKQSITPLNKLVAEFAIYGKNPKNPVHVINLFRLKEQRKMDISVAVEDQIYHFFLSIKFSHKRGIVMLKLTPHYKIHNNFHSPILFKIQAASQTVVVKGNSTEYFNKVGFDSSFIFTMEANDYGSQPTKLDLKKCVIPVKFSHNIAFSLRFDNNNLILQPPLIVRNLATLPVQIFDFNNSLIVTLPNQNSEDFIGPLDFFKDNSVRLSIQIDGYEKSKEFKTTMGKKTLFLKSYSDDIYAPIALHFSVGATGIIYLRIDHLIYVRNESTQTIHFVPIDKDGKEKTNHSLDVNPGEVKPVLLCSAELNAVFKIDNSRKVYKLNLENSLENRNKFATLFFNNSINSSKNVMMSIDFQSSSTLPGHFIVVKSCVFPQPLVLSNLLGEKDQLKCVDVIVNKGLESQQIVKTMTTSIISSRDLVGQKLKVECYNHEYEIDLNKFTEPTKETIKIDTVCIDIYFKLVCLENGSHLIIVSNEIENKPNRFNLLATHEISFTMSIPFISLSLIDDRMKELSLIAFQNSSIKCQFTKDTVELDLQIDYFQIDDLYPDTIVPVAVFNSTAPFISLKVIKENANMIFDLIDLRLHPMTFYIDMNYIAELLSLFTSIKRPKRDASIDTKVQSTKSSIPILIKKLFIDKIQINVSASCQTGRPMFHPFPYAFLDFFPTSSSIELNRKPFTQNDLTSDNRSLNKMLKDYYKPLLGQIKGLVAARSLAFAFKGFSNAVHKMNSAKKVDVSFNQEKGVVVQRGFESFGKGLLNGITGVVMKPVKGVKQDGAKGFFVGLTKGVTGIITDPLAGLIDAGAGIIDEVKNSMSESRDLVRYPRVLLNYQVQEYDAIGAICQLQFQRHVKNYNINLVYFVNGSDGFVGITDTDIATFVPNNQKKNPSKPFSVDKVKRIADIESVSANDKNLVIKFHDKFEINVTCQTPTIASIATKVIVSRSYYCNYCSNSSNMTRIASTNFERQEQSQPSQTPALLIPDGFYSLKSSNGKYVTNDKDILPLLANRSTCKGWEKFKITNNDDGTISFFSVKNNKYVSVRSKSKLMANAAKIARDEKFSVTKVDDNTYNFLSMKTQQYVSADRNKLGALYANRDHAYGWERFVLIPRD